MPMHKSVKPPIKIIHAEVIHSPLSSKKQEILGFLKDCFLLLNQPHPVSTTFCWWPTLGQPVLQTSWAGVQASRTWSMEFLLCGFKSTMGLALRSWGRNTASVLPKAVNINPQTCILSANCFQLISLPLRWNCHRVLESQCICLFLGKHNKSKIQEKVLASPQADVRDTKREMQTFTAGPLSN